MFDRYYTFGLTFSQAKLPVISFILRWTEDHQRAVEELPVILAVGLTSCLQLPFKVGFGGIDGWNGRRIPHVVSHGSTDVTQTAIFILKVIWFQKDNKQVVKVIHAGS